MDHAMYRDGFRLLMIMIHDAFMHVQRPRREVAEQGHEPD